MSPISVSRWVSAYIAGGIEALTPGHYGGNHRNISEAEEIAFLDQFKKAAEQGQVITVAEIAKAYDEQFGMKHATPSTVYYLLHKHGWRKLLPRSRHSKRASEEVVDVSKKLTLESEN